MSKLPHAPFSQPNFVAVMTALLQPLVDQQNVTFSIPNLYNIDTAVGVHLDTVGQWIGPTRFVQIPLTGLFFSFDTVGLGFDQGAWAPVGDGITAQYALPDNEYRLLLYATIAANHWDGTVPGGERVLNQFWNPLGYSEYIIDHQDMTIAFLLVGPIPNAVQQALYDGGYLDVVNAGVGVTAHYFVEGSGGIPFTPLFGFDIDNAFIAGFDQGVWAEEGFTPSAALFMSGSIVEAIDTANVHAYLPAASTLSGAPRELPDQVQSFNTSAAGSVTVRELPDSVVSLSTGSTYATLTGSTIETPDMVASEGGSMSVGAGAIPEHSDTARVSGGDLSVGSSVIPESVDPVSATATVT